MGPFNYPLANYLSFQRRRSLGCSTKVKAPSCCYGDEGGGVEGVPVPIQASQALPRGLLQGPVLAWGQLSSTGPIF